MRIDQTPKPSVNIEVSFGTDSSMIQEILFGIEEEGIPYQVEQNLKAEAQQLAFKASQQSKLSVGIGFKDNCVVLHQRNIPENLFIYRIQDINQVSSDSLRTFGINAARLVKSIPFRVNQELEVLN